MAISTSATLFNEVPGARKIAVKQITFGTYATNGVSVTVSDFPDFYRVDAVVPIVLTKLDGTVNDLKWDQTNKKIVLYNGTTEVTNSTDLSTYGAMVLVVGI
jgi:hypothetical protein